MKPAVSARPGQQIIRQATWPDAFPPDIRVFRVPDKLMRRCPLCDERKHAKEYEYGHTLCRPCERPGSGQRMLERLAREEREQMEQAQQAQEATT